MFQHFWSILEVPVQYFFIFSSHVSCMFPMCSRIHFKDSPGRCHCKGCLIVKPCEATVWVRQCSKLNWQSVANQQNSQCNVNVIISNEPSPFIVWYVCDAWSHLKPKFRDEKHNGEILATLRDVCLGLHRASQVMCLLPGVGRGPETERHSDAAGFGGQQHRRWRGEGLVFGEGGDMRGVGVKKGKGRIKTRPYESDSREMTKGNAMHVDFQMHSSGWNLWWQGIGVFWCIWHVLARSWLKRNNS